MEVRCLGSDLLDRCDCFIGAPKLEQCARLADQESGLVAKRTSQDRVIVLERLLRLADAQAFLGESASVGDRVDNIELVPERAIAPARIDRSRDRPARPLRPKGTEPFGRKPERDIHEGAHSRQKQDHQAPWHEPSGPRRMNDEQDVESCYQNAGVQLRLLAARARLRPSLRDEFHERHMGMTRALRPVCIRHRRIPFGLHQRRISAGIAMWTECGRITQSPQTSTRPSWWRKEFER